MSAYYKLSFTGKEIEEKLLRVEADGVGYEVDGVVNTISDKYIPPMESLMFNGDDCGTYMIYVENGTLCTKATVRPNLASLSKLSVTKGAIWSQSGFVWNIEKVQPVDGLIFNTDNLVAGETYTFSYKFQKTGGTLKNIGGHREAFSEIELYVDGRLVSPSGTYVNGVAVPDDNAVHDVVFVCTYIGNTSSNSNLYIQVNRKLSTLVSCSIWDVKMEHGDTATEWVPAKEDVKQDAEVFDFIIHSGEYGTLSLQAQRGMTWDDWVESEYNISPEGYKYFIAEHYESSSYKNIRHDSMIFTYLVCHDASCGSYESVRSDEVIGCGCEYMCNP